MNPKPLVPIIFACILGASILSIPLLTEQGPDQAPGEPEDVPPTEGPAGYSLPFSHPLDDTDILFNITNDSPDNQTIELSLRREEKLPAFFQVGAELIHRNGSYSNFFAGEWVGSTGGAGRGVVAVHSDPVSIEAPVIDPPLIGRMENFEVDGSVAIEPGSHHLFVTVQNVDMELLIASMDTTAQVRIEVVMEDPEMDRMLWAHVPGHWNEVHREVYAAYGLGGWIEASTTVELKNSYRSIMVIGSGDYAELQATDETGRTCSASRIEPPQIGAFTFKPSLGEVKIEGVNGAFSSVAFLLARVRDIPIEWEGVSEWCW